MSNALQWLNDLIQWFGKFVPRLTMVPPTHAGVLFGPRGGARSCGPGVVAWWPLLYQLVRIPVTTQSIQIAARSVPHHSTGPIPWVTIIGLAVQYRVVDPVKAATRVLNLHALLDNRCQASAGRYWDSTDRARETIRRAIGEIRDGLADDYGVWIERADVTHLGQGVIVLQTHDYAWTDDANGTPRGEES